ncbi:metallophosphoesterase family protein [Rhodalgimonas zhirmunskyi]|uniref:Metallophosphoesterase n=1 Tax=Rhodalgimonas zhirmunskyi TaxID=2964767 RepID=A0AAJ1UCA7_9RHOB|nr:metallophosphoesterase [Rhodoalgimonas zhirmunskyi]MDQ2093926.1 metallophosphoesterase [Rhodoalgimonas zhirmunskyi]
MTATRILHISDLHFGRDRPELAAPLLSFIAEATPDLVVISGDLTQRARPAQFKEARAFLNRIEAETLVVPGNHDIPLHRPFIRLFRPFSRYKRWISRDLEPCREVGEVGVIGVNTVDAYAWQRGRFRKRSLRKVCDFALAREDRIELVVAHHPMENPEDSHKRAMRGAAAALGELHRCGADIVLCGHLHHWRAAPHHAAAGVLLIQAGTGLSTRTRGEANDLNLIDISGECVDVTRHIADEATGTFTPAEHVTFTRDSGFWQAVQARRIAPGEPRLTSADGTTGPPTETPTGSRPPPARIA